MCFLFLTLTFCSQKPKDTVIKCYVLLLNLGFYPNVYNLYLIRSFLSFVFFLHLPLICSPWHTWIHFHLMGELCYKHRQYHLASQSPPHYHLLVFCLWLLNSWMCLCTFLSYLLVMYVLLWGVVLRLWLDIQCRFLHWLSMVSRASSPHPLTLCPSDSSTPVCHERGISILEQASS